MNEKPKTDPTTTSSPPPATLGEMRLVLTVPEFGARYKAGKTTAYKWIIMGLPHLKLSTRKTRVPIHEGDRWMKENFLRQRET
jgi:hypothetical protein